MTPSEYLQSQHAAYRNLGQDEDEDSLWMAAHAHPRTADYHRYRAFFESLAYASGIGARYAAFQSPRNYVEYYAPRLSVSWAPSDIPGIEGEISPLRDKLRWLAYLQTAAALGWPAGCTPALYAGTWIIHTDSKDALDDIRTTRGAQVEILESGLWQITCPDPSESSMERLHRLIKRHFGRAALPPPATLGSRPQPGDTVSLTRPQHTPPPG